MNPYAHQLMNQAFLRNAQMQGGEYLDIDYGGASTYNKFQKEVAKQARIYGIAIHPGTPKYHKMWCEYVDAMGIASKTCNTIKHTKKSNLTSLQFIKALVKKFYLPKPVKNIDFDIDFNDDTDVWDIENSDDEFKYSADQPIVQRTPLVECQEKLAKLREILGSGTYGRGILVGGASKKKANSKSTKKKSSSRNKGNPWSKFITLWAKKHDKTLTQAMKSAQAKREYCTWIGKSRKSLGVTKAKKCKLTGRPTKRQTAARKKLEKCAINKRTLTALKKCRAAGILI